MDSNTHSDDGPTGPADELAELSALLDRLQAQDLDRFPDAARAERVLALRRLADRPHRAGPPATRSRPAPGHRWGPAPAERDRRPAQPRPPRRPGRPGGRGGSAGPAGGEMGGAGPLEPQACRRLACDATITRVIVNRQPLGACACQFPSNPQDPKGSDLEGAAAGGAGQTPPNPGRRPLPAPGRRPGHPGGQPDPTQRPGRPRRRLCLPRLLAAAGLVRSHHVRHWLDGGPTDLDNLALLSRAQHRAIHEGGWRLARGPDGRFTATPPYRRHQAA
jgi:hypothetical protein